MHEADARSPGGAALLACAIEVSAPKAGNVHAGAAFDDAAWEHFVLSALVCRPLLDRARDAGVGATLLACVNATRNAVGTNTNLGMLLLLAPLCAAVHEPGDSVGALRSAVERVLDSLTDDDARLTYDAIRLASPGGLGEAESGDVQSPPTTSLVEAMRLAADRDAVARQYVTGFDTVFTVAADIARLLDEGLAVDATIVAAHLMQMAREPDTLIARKCGSGIAAESQRLAAGVLDDTPVDGLNTSEGFAAFDRWLRADGRRRNPGTSADLVAAGLYVVARRGMLREPVPWLSPIDGSSP